MMQNNTLPDKIEQKVFNYLSVMSFPYTDIIIEQITTAKREVVAQPCYVDLKYTVDPTVRKIPQLPSVTPLNVNYCDGKELRATLILFVRDGCVESIELDSWLVEKTAQDVYENRPIDWNCFFNAEPLIYIDSWSELSHE